MKLLYSRWSFRVKAFERTTGICALLCASFCGTPAFPAQAAEGEAGAIRLQNPNLSAEGVFQFSFEAQAEQTYPISVSSDLAHWSLLTNIVGTGALSVQDHDALNFERRFYHAGIPSALPTPITNMVLIAPGTFLMGSPETEAGRDPNEGPLTLVTLSRAFWIGKYEVTQVEYLTLMGSNISFFGYDTRLPVDAATWPQATNYCHQLTLRERAAGRLPPGYKYRLPTEAEWEYACRAGSTTPFGVGDGTTLGTNQATFDWTFPYGDAPSGPYKKLSTLGGSYPPNAWGLYDMHGNVWEWCQDFFAPYASGRVTDPKGPATGSTRVLRGGGYTSVGQGCRSAKRDNRTQTYANVIQGFRVVLAEDL